MASGHGVSVLVTVLFAIVAAWSIVRLVVAYSWIDRVSNGLHVVMAVVMILMPWSAYAKLPAVAQIVFFSAAALWYVYLALFDPHAQAGPGEGHHRGPALLWYHAGMMASMVWMAIAMTPLTTSSMPGMSMSGMDMGSGHSGAMAMTGSAQWAVSLSWVFGILFGLAAIWFIFRLGVLAVATDDFRGHAFIQILDSAASVLMAAGMGIAFIFLMT